MIDNFNNQPYEHFGELTHRNKEFSVNIGLEHISHKIENMQYENGFVFADVNILDTPSGRVAKNILDSSNMNLYASPVCIKDNDTGEMQLLYCNLTPYPTNISKYPVEKDEKD